jgi:hypothetical protein
VATCALDGPTVGTVEGLALEDTIGTAPGAKDGAFDDELLAFGTAVGTPEGDTEGAINGTAAGVADGAMVKTTIVVVYSE